MKYLFFATLIVTVLESCSKSKGTPAPSKPQMGTTWTYRYRKFTAIGGIQESYNIRYRITAEQTLGGKKWFAVTDSTGAVVWLLNVQSDGLYQYISNSEAMLAKDPANVGDSYLGKNENGDITFIVKEKGVDIGTPGGDQNVNRYEGTQGGLTKMMLWYNPSVWIVRQDNYAVNPFTNANYVNTRIEFVSIAY